MASSESLDSYLVTTPETHRVTRARARVVTISDIKLFNYETFWPEAFYTFRIEITDSNKKNLKSVEGTAHKGQVAWKERIALSDINPNSIVVLKVFKKAIGRLKPIGEYSNSVSYFLNMQRSSDVYRPNLGKTSQLTFTIEESYSQNIVEEAINRVENTVLLNLLNERDTWSTFSCYFQLVKNAIDSVSQFNPYFQQVWSILSLVPGIIQTHLSRNSNINKLVQRMIDVYKFIFDANQLLVAQSQNVKLLIQQTLECAYFIKEYVEKNTSEKTWEVPMVDSKIQEFTEKFNQIFDAIRNSSILETNIVTLRVSHSIDEIKDSNLLGEMPYASNAGFAAAKRCLPGTRQKLISEILEWVNNYVDTPQRYFILSGQAGMGKSSVAHTIAEIFRGQNRLGSLFCFSRNDKKRLDFLFSTISRDLADSDVAWQKGLAKAVKETAIRKSLDPTTQFNELMIKPAKDAETIGPVVIIIDALDESGDRAERQILLDLLFKRGGELPSNYRFVVTSRPEPDIEERYQLPTVFCKHMAQLNEEDTKNDIIQFVSHKLSSMAKTLDEELKSDWRASLAEKAQGLFQWANLACIYINPSFEIGHGLWTVGSKSTSSMNELYHEILESSPEFKREGFLALFRTVVGALVVSQKPLTSSALQVLFGPDIEDTTVDEVLKPFHSLFIGADEPATEIRPLHTSLFDFFMNPEQKPGTPNQFYIDTSDHSLFTRACLRLMNGKLRFNMCKLETSHLRNRDVPNYDRRVAEVIPLPLSYACCFWANHLKCSEFNSDLLNEIRHLMHANLLYFFETLSLLGKVDHGRDGMQILKDQIKDKDGELADQAADALLFVSEFGDMMMESTPHLYLSALSYISKQSFISKQFISQYSQLLRWDIQAEDGDSQTLCNNTNKTELREVWWKSQHLVLLLDIPGEGTYFHIVDPTKTDKTKLKTGESHAGVRAVSPEDNHWSLAYVGSSGLCLWNIDTKQEFVLDKSGHNITKLAFSITGDRLISGDSRGNIKIWDVRARQTQVGDWNNLHSGADSTNKLELREVWSKSQHVILLIGIPGVGSHFHIVDPTKKNGMGVKIGESLASVRAVSPEDNHWSLAYVGSSGLCLWSIDTKQEFVLDKSGHNITKLAFSITGDRLISNDSRGNIKIWDVRTRQTISTDKLSVSVEWLNAVAFPSINSAFIVAYTTANHKTFIEIRDRGSRAVLKGPFESSTPIQSLSSTPKDAHLVCQSALRLEILDTSTGKSRCFDTVTSILSPNRKYIAWVPMRNKKQVKFWDSDADIELDGPSFDHSINRLEFSADSKRVSVIFGADKGEGRISIWDIKLKQLIIRPFSCIMDCWPSIPHAALHGNSLFLAFDRDSGKMWDLSVLEIMSYLYEDHSGDNSPPSARKLEAQRLIEEYRTKYGNTETLKYALIPWEKARFSGFAKINENGWVLGPQEELLFWVPKKARKCLALPCMTHLNEKEFIKLNFDKFVHGTKWMECKNLASDFRHRATWGLKLLKY